MTPIRQSKFSSDDGMVHGNCFGTCVAALLDLDPAEVPAFEDMPDGAWFQPFYKLLREKGYTFAGTFHCRNLDAFPVEDLAERSAGVGGLFIVGGESPRGFARGHAVIYNCGGELIHDPHPSGAGIAKLWDVYMIEPIAEEK